MRMSALSKICVGKKHKKASYLWRAIWRPGLGARMKNLDVIQSRLNNSQLVM